MAVLVSHSRHSIHHIINTLPKANLLTTVAGEDGMGHNIRMPDTALSGIELTTDTDHLCKAILPTSLHTTIAILLRITRISHIHSKVTILTEEAMEVLEETTTMALIDACRDPAATHLLACQVAEVAVRHQHSFLICPGHQRREREVAVQLQKHPALN